MKKPGLTFLFLIFCSLFLILVSCSLQKQISRSAQQVIKDSSLHTAHVGISIYEPGTDKYWYNYNADKYFVPASNTKIPTCYAAMKYLGDSLTGVRYGDDEKGRMLIRPTGDPTFLHPDFKNQPVYEFLKKKNQPILITNADFIENQLGSGWAWNDYNEAYMAERSAFPVYGNISKWKMITDSNYIPKGRPYDIVAAPGFFRDSLVMIHPSLTTKEHLDKVNRTVFHFAIQRKRSQNVFELVNSASQFNTGAIPFETSNLQTLAHILKDTLNIEVEVNEKTWIFNRPAVKSQPTDSVLKPMMHRSDNFFAEQFLLMVSNERLGIMSDEKIIDTLLKTDFKDLPQKPRWTDGSGLSRYNLFTPQDFVFILHKMKSEFGMERIQTIFPTGGEGTLSNYYIMDRGYIYAKTGTLSGVVSLSGYIYTKKNKLLVFSVLVNNHQASATAVRRSVEKFLRRIRNKW